MLSDHRGCSRSCAVSLFAGFVTCQGNLSMGYYLFASILVMALLFVISSKPGIPAALGRRTMSIFIWHTFVLILLFDVFHGKEWILQIYPTYYVPAVILIAFFVTIVCAFLPTPHIFV